MENLESRLALLERRSGRSRLVSLASLGLGVLGLGVAALRPMKPVRDDELMASRVTLRDAQGRTTQLVAGYARRIFGTAPRPEFLQLVIAALHRDFHAALAALREALGDDPDHNVGIVAGKTLERRQRADDLTAASEV